MKVKALAGILAVCFAAPAFAQSNVTIYGIADAGLVKVSGAPMRIASGIADGSRIGFKGTEDLGGGMKAIFNLEARVELDNGTQQPTLIADNQGYYLTRGMGALPPTVLAGIRSAIQPKGGPTVNQEKALFDRTSMVGLITPVGAVLFGRMYTPGYEVFAAADTFESGMSGSWGHVTGGTAGFTALGADIRSQRSVQYRFAVPSGFGGALMYGAKNSGYLGRYNKFEAMNLTYKANGLDVGFGFNRGFDQGDARSLTTYTIGGSYTDGGPIKFFFGYHDQVNNNSVLTREYIAGWDGVIAPQLAALPAATQAALRGIFTTNIAKNVVQDAASLQFGMHYKVGAGRFMASVARQNDRTLSDSDAVMYAVGYDYNLSKRTDVYASAAFIKNSHDAQYVPGTAGTPGGFADGLGVNTKGYSIGMRHKF